MKFKVQSGRTKKPTLKDCIYGQAVGDALGVPFEFRLRGTFRCEDMVGNGTHNQPAGTWSDDTSMALAVCDSYRELGKIDTHDIREKFNVWFREGAYTCGETFDVGETTAQSLLTNKGQDGEFDNGNGSLMRTIPLAFTDATDTEIEEVSAITHAHKMSRKACVNMVKAARLLIAGDNPMSVAEQAGVDYKKPESEIFSSGYVLHTFEASLWCLANTSTYKDCVLKAVNLGDDTDTTAAVAGGLAGIAYGFGAIPAKWIEILRGKQVIDSCLFDK